jgi:hypothetical protein
MAIVLKRASRLPFAPIVAGLFALAAAVLVMATPGWLLETLVEKTGIASIVSAAAPPLGMKARALLAVLAALGTGLVLWLALVPVARLLDRKRKPVAAIKPAQSFEPVADVTAGESLGRVRRPIFADRDLGAPFMSEEALSDAPILAPTPTDAFDPDELVLDMNFVQAAAEPAPLVLDPPAHAVDDHQLVEPFESVIADQPMPQAVAFDMGTVEPLAEEAAAPFPVADYHAPQAPEFAAPDYSAVASSIPVLPPQDAHAGESITELVERLERGLERRAAAIAAARAAADAAIAVQAVEAAPSNATHPLASAQKEVDSALQQALNTLERLAAGGR